LICIDICFIFAFVCTANMLLHFEHCKYRYSIFINRKKSHTKTLQRRFFSTTITQQINFYFSDKQPVNFFLCCTTYFSICFSVKKTVKLQEFSEIETIKM